MEQLTEEAYASLLGAVADQAFSISAFCCLSPLAVVFPTSSDRPRFDCSFCGTNGFVGGANHAWALVGLGEAIRSWPFETVAAMSTTLARLGAALVGEGAWTTGLYGRDRLERPVLARSPGCLVCGLPTGSIRRDVNGRPYLTDPDGCRSRIFFRSELALARYVGWCVARQMAAQDPWSTWRANGRLAWMSWLTPNAAPTPTSPLQIEADWALVPPEPAPVAHPIPATAEEDPDA